MTEAAGEETGAPNSSRARLLRADGARQVQVRPHHCMQLTRTLFQNSGPSLSEGRGLLRFDSRGWLSHLKNFRGGRRRPKYGTVIAASRHLLASTLATATRLNLSACK